jgi:acetoin utilization protein AcuB
MPVREWMHRDPVVVRADAPIAVATDLLRTRKIRHLPVVDAADRLVGIVTDRDLRQVVFDPAIQARLQRATEALRGLTVREVMTWGAITVTPTTPVADAARLMHERKVGSLPVVEQDRVVGILTERDVLRTLREVLTEGVLARPYRWAFAYR